MSDHDDLARRAGRVLAWWDGDGDGPSYRQVDLSVGELVGVVRDLLAEVKRLDAERDTERDRALRLSIKLAGHPDGSAWAAELHDEYERRAR